MRPRSAHPMFFRKRVSPWNRGRGTRRAECFQQCTPGQVKAKSHFVPLDLRETSEESEDRSGGTAQSSIAQDVGTESAALS